jgi:hypothetical protein
MDSGRVRFRVPDSPFTIVRVDSVTFLRVPRCDAVRELLAV